MHIIRGGTSPTYVVGPAIEDQRDCWEETPRREVQVEGGEFVTLPLAPHLSGPRCLGTVSFLGGGRGLSRWSRGRDRPGSKILGTLGPGRRPEGSGRTKRPGVVTVNNCNHRRRARRC